MQTFAILTILFVAGVAAEQSQEAPVGHMQPGPANIRPYTCRKPEPVAVVGQPQHAVEGVHQAAQQQQHNHHQQGQIVAHSEQVYGIQHPQYYSPSGIIQVEQAAHQQAQFKPVQQGVRQYAAAPIEQYGQPESAAVPPNYKPFGSWGLYIGGNPADGYYSSYYKALSNTVDKQQIQGEQQVKPSAVVGQASGIGPMLKQGPIVSYQDQGYPYGDYYTPADLNSGSRVSVQGQVAPAVYSNGQLVSYDYPAGVLSYSADSNAANKRLGQQTIKEPQQQGVPPAPAKGYYQQRVAYSPVAYAPVHHHVQQQQQQVVAYPVPVGSQIVGSQPEAYQPGADPQQPYGVHGFTRYAIKPTVVGQEQQTYYPHGVHSSPVSQFPAYKQQQPQYVQGAYHQPLGFYGYPLSQLHYSQGSIQPTFGSQEGSASSTGIQHSAQQIGGVGSVAHSPAGAAHSIEAASSDKSVSEAENKQVNKQQ